MACKVSNLRFVGGVTLVGYTSVSVLRTGSKLYTAPCKCRVWFRVASASYYIYFAINKTGTGTSPTDYDIRSDSYYWEIPQQSQDKVLKRNINSCGNYAFSIDLEKDDYIYMWTSDTADRDGYYTVYAI